MNVNYPLDYTISELRILNAISEKCSMGLQCIVESFREEDKVYLILEYIQGGTMYDYIEAWTNELNVVKVMLDSNKAIKELHEMGLIHRDIKPENIMVDVDNGQVKVVVIDYGAARFIGTKSPVCDFSVLSGTEEHLSYYAYDQYLFLNPQIQSDSDDEDYDKPIPEISELGGVFTDKQKYNVDIFALGVTFYMLLYKNYNPWNVKRDMYFHKRVRSNIKHGKFIRRKSFSPVLDSLIERMMSSKEEDFVGINEVVHILESVHQQILSKNT